MSRFALYQGQRISKRDAESHCNTESHCDSESALHYYDCPLCGTQVVLNGEFIHTTNEPNCGYYRDADADLQLATKYFTEILQIQTITIEHNCNTCKSTIDSTIIVYDETAVITTNGIIDYCLDGYLIYQFLITDRSVPDHVSDCKWFALNSNDIINAINTNSAFRCIRNEVCQACIDGDNKQEKVSDAVSGIPDTSDTVPNAFATVPDSFGTTPNVVSDAVSNISDTADMLDDFSCFSLN